MKKRNVLIGILLLLVAGLCCRVIDLKWDLLFKTLSQVPVLGLIVEYNFPPADYSIPLFDVPLRTGEVNVPFSCKYKGRHEIDIIGCEDSPVERSEIGLSVNVTDGEGWLVYQMVQTNEEALVSYDDKGNRYMRFCYAVVFAPEDLPTDVPLYFSYSCFGALESFKNRNPDARIVLRKFFCK